MSRLIDADALYERACSLEAQALDYVGKLIERDGDEVSEEWKIWSAILTERTAFKHDVFDAPTIEERKTGKWTPKENRPKQEVFICSECGGLAYSPWIGSRKTPKPNKCKYSYCPNCGADMRGD